MAGETEALELAQEDLGTLTVEDVVCTNCIEGFCPARTPSCFAGEPFMFCGAKKASQPVIAAFQERTGIELHIERPC